MAFGRALSLAGGRAAVLASLVFAGAIAASPAASAVVVPIPIRVVVVTTFEPGRDEGDVPGEFQTWVERLPLTDKLAFPAGYRPLRYNRARGVLGIVTGEGAERGAASIMALGLDPRFDVRRAYWLVAGIAGVDPNVASAGSAAWARWVVNADLGFELDARDMPHAWTTGIVPFDRTRPFAAPPPDADSIHGVAAYRLNETLANWAYALTAATPLTDTTNLRQLRKPYARFPNATRGPFVLRGESLCGDRFWIGASMNAWAERWVSYWTAGRGTFTMTAEEDAGIMQSLTFLARAGRVDLRRALVLRTASNYSRPGSGHDAVRLLTSNAGAHGESAYLEAIDSAYRVGRIVVNELTEHWKRYSVTIPADRF